MEPKFDIVIYHSPCVDGTAAAFIVQVYNQEHPCEFFGTKPGLDNYDFPNVTGKNVIILDISFPRETMIDLHSKAKYLLCLDHHKSAEDQLSDLDFCIFDMKRSGAQLAWDHLTPYVPAFDPKITRPDFIDFIGGRDLWDFSKPGTEEFCTGLFEISRGYDREKMFALLDLLLCQTGYMYRDGMWKPSDIPAEAESTYAEIETTGRICSTMRNRAVEAACKSAVRCRMSDKYTVWAIDSWRAHDRSKAGNILAAREDCDFAVSHSYDLPNDAWWISMRSLKEKMDVSVVAREYPKGGGHPCASGFTWRGSLRDLLEPITDNS